MTIILLAIPKSFIKHKHSQSHLDLPQTCPFKSPPIFNVCVRISISSKSSTISTSNFLRHNTSSLSTYHSFDRCRLPLSSAIKNYTNSIPGSIHSSSRSKHISCGFWLGRNIAIWKVISRLKGFVIVTIFVDPSMKPQLPTLYRVENF